MEYFGQDIGTFSITTLVGTSPGAKDITEILSSINTKPSDVRQEATPLKRTAVKHRHIRTDDSLAFTVFVGSDGLAAHLLDNRNKELTFSCEAYDDGITYADTLGLLCYLGHDMVDGAQVINFEFINIEL